MSDELLWRSYTPDLSVRSDGDGRTIEGIVVPFGQVATVSDGGPAYREAFQKGAFARTINGRQDKVKLLAHHNARVNPLGRSVALREDAAGLFGSFKVSKTAAGDEALELARDGAMDSFSVGFGPQQQVKRDGVLWRTEVRLREVSLVTIPAYEGAMVTGVRSLSELSEEERAEWLRFFGEHFDLRSLTPAKDPNEQGTSPEPAHAEDSTGSTASHSLRQVQFTFAAEMRKRGVRS